MTSKQLRSSILQAAIQGQLVPQEPSDTPAALLLERIQAERERLIEERKIRRDKNASVIYRTDEGSYYERNLTSGEETCIDDEIPFDIPDSWQWTRLEQILQIIMGQSPDGTSISEDESGMEFHQGKISFGDKIIRKSAYFTTAPKKVAPENSLLLCVRAPVGLINITDRELCIGRGLCALVPMVGSPLFYFWLFHPLIPEFNAKATGSTFKAISLEIVKKQLFPIPPLEEQERIVARIEELMTLVDQYEQAKVALDELESTLPDMLQQSILQAAIQGQLVPQEPSDTPAALLLERIQAERERLIKERKIRRDKNASVIYRTDEGSYYERNLTSGEETCIDNEIPFDIPDSWQWTRLEQILQIIMGQSPDGTSISEDESGMEFHQGKISFGDKIIRKSAYFTTAPKKVAPENSLLLCVRAPVGLINITDRELCIGRGLCALVPMVGSPLFYFWLFHPLIPEFNAKATGSTFKAISLEIVKKQLFPIPPLEEQERIVARIEELMRYTNRLKSFTNPN